MDEREYLRKCQAESAGMSPKADVNLQPNNPRPSSEVPKEVKANAQYQQMKELSEPCTVNVQGIRLSGYDCKKSKRTF